ncbi:McrB family protein [Persephonella sp.]
MYYSDRLERRIEELKSLEEEQFWYITKQELKIPELCKAIESFRNGQLTPDAANYRKLNNAYWYGLWKKNSNRYEDADDTEVFTKIKERSNGDFDNINSYKDIMINQAEKVFIWNPLDNQTSRQIFKIHPVMFTYKVLLEIGDITGNYEISLNEFKTFLGTSLKYEEYFDTTLLILEYRENPSLINSHEIIAKVEDNRFNRVLENIEYFTITRDRISLKPEFINVVRQKICKYEYLIKHPDAASRIFSTDFLIILKSFEDLYNEFLTKESNNTLQNNFTSTNIRGYNKLFYGSPGTGKSYKVDLLTRGKKVYRTTFYPEYDYFKFVGSYKPVSNNGNIEYKFVPQVFLNAYIEAWKNPDEEVYLVIEEINRGNAPEIFGDLLQLLDRDENGISKYAVNIDVEAQKFLIETFNNDLEHPAIKDGKIRLPNNLFILATMNTSDQSLFPIDSAFKRRWSWEYIPINYKDTNSNFIIDIDGHKFFWLSFIKIVNKIIYQLTGSSDKQIGNWFVNPSNGIINKNEFVYKVLFYLWNDIFKEEESSIFEINNESITYEDIFSNGEINTNIVIQILENLNVEKI